MGELLLINIVEEMLLGMWHLVILLPPKRGERAGNSEPGRASAFTQKRLSRQNNL